MTTCEDDVGHTVAHTFQCTANCLTKPLRNCSECSVRLAMLIKFTKNKRLKCTKDGHVCVMSVQKWVIGYIWHMTVSISNVALFGYRANVINEQNHTRAHKGLSLKKKNNKKKTKQKKTTKNSLYTFSVIFLLHRIIYTTNVKKGKRKVQGVPQSQTIALPRHKRKSKQINPNKHKSNKRTKSTKISSLFPKRGNRNAERTEKHKNKITQGNT